MKKFRLLPVILSILITTGCGSGGESPQEQDAVLARSHYLALTQATGLCHLLVDYGERVYEFSMAVSVTQENEQRSISQTLTAPAEIAGITVTQVGVGAESKLIWEDVLLETGDLSQDGLSPVTAFPQLFHCLTTAYIQSATLVSEGEILQLLCRDPALEMGQGQEVVLWLDSGSYDLLGGEIYQDGQRVIACEMESFLGY